MNKELQDKAWACLPKEMRNKLKEKYFRDLGNTILNMGFDVVLDYVFGEHNLTSDTEPPEMLHVEKWKVQDMRSYNLDVLKHDPTHKGALLLEQSLKHLFGNACLPDKRNEDNFAKPEKTNNSTISSTDSVKNSQEAEVETQKYKFKIGDKVVVKGVTKPDLNDRIAFISGFPNEYYPYFKVTFPEGTWTSLSEKYLEPYTEENASKTENAITEPKSEENLRNMEEKELDLIQLLKGCEGETFYSHAYGEVTLNEIVRDDRPNSQEIKCYTPDPQSDRIWFLRDGRKHKNGGIDLYPSEELLRKYPLDAPTAWKIWSEERKPKRWRAEKGQSYYFIDNDGFLWREKEGGYLTDNKRYDFGNYFRTESDAKQAVESIRQYLKDFHNQKKAE